MTTVGLASSADLAFGGAGAEAITLAFVFTASPYSASSLEAGGGVLVCWTLFGSKG